MRLVDLLNALHSDLEEAKKAGTTDTQLEANYHRLVARFDELQVYKTSDDVPVVGISVSDIKRDLKVARNAFYSVHSSLIDKEITSSSYLRELDKLSSKIGVMAKEAGEEYIRSSMIAFTIQNPNPPTFEKVQTVVAAASPQKTFKSLVEVQQQLDATKKDLEAAEKIQFGKDIDDPLHVRWLRENQSAPATPEGYRALQDKNKTDHDPIDAEKDNRVKQTSVNQDEQARTILERYQPALRKLAAEQTPPNMYWTVAKGPVFFMSTPPLRELQVKGLKFRFDPFYPGWILADQYLLGVKPSMLKDKKQLLETLKYIRETLSQRFYTPFLFMSLPHVDLNKRKIGTNKVEEVHHENIKTFSTEKEKGKTVNYTSLNKKKSRTDPGLKDALATDIPKFKPLPGSNLLWTWLMPEQKYHTLPMISIRNWGFPTVDGMRSVEERMAGSILPSLKEDQSKRAAFIAEYSQKAAKRYHEEAKPLDDKLKETQNKSATFQMTLDDLKRQAAEQAKALSELHHELMLAGIGSMRASIQKEILGQENKLDVLTGQIEGYKSIVKALAGEAKSILAQRSAMESRIRQEEMAALKAIHEGKQPEEPK